MKQTLLNYIQEQLLTDPEIELVAEDDLLGGGLVDSIGMVKLISFIEKEYQLTIPPQDMLIENFMSVNHIEQYLEGRKQ